MIDPYTLGERALPDGRHVYLTAMTYGKVRLHIAPYAGAMTFLAGY